MKLFTEETASLRVQVMDGHKINAAVISSSHQDFADSAPVVAIIDAKKFVKICYAEGSEAYLVEWRDMQWLFNE